MYSMTRQQKDWGTGGHSEPPKHFWKVIGAAVIFCSVMAAIMARCQGAL